MPFVLLQILVIPLLATLMIFLGRKSLGYAAGWVAALAMSYTTILVVSVGFTVHRGDPLSETYLLIAPGIHLGLLADGLSLPTLAIVCFLCTVLAFYSIRYMAQRVEVLYAEESKDVRRSYYVRFFYLFPLFPVGFIGTILSTNLVSIYFFLEVLTLTLFFLMASFGYRDRVKVAFVSLSWGIIGALLFLVAALMVYSQIQSLEVHALGELAGNPLVVGIISVFLLSLIMKLALFPFHVWMPSVHAEHPTCIAGLLAIYANLALYIIIRVLILPLTADFEPFGLPLMFLALVTMVYGSLLTLAQTDIKRLAACSTISQIAYSVLGIGALTVAGLEGGMFFFLSHILGKTLFFSTAGIVVYVTGIRDMRQLGGLAQKMPITATLWIIGCMMLSGFPPFSSFTAEWIMFTGVFERGLVNSPSAIAIGVGGLLAILLTVSYSFGAAKKIFFGPLDPELEKNENIRDPGWLMTVPLFTVAIISIVLGLYPKIITDFLHTILIIPT